MASSLETSAPAASRPGGVPLSWPRAALALGCLWLLFALPAALGGPSWRLLILPLEALLLAALLLLLPAGAGRLLVWPLAVIASLAGLLQVMGWAMIDIFGRPLNPVLDLELLPKLFELVTGATSAPAAAGILLLVLTLLVALLLTVRWSLAGFARAEAPRLAILAIVAALAAWQVPALAGIPGTVSTQLSSSLYDQGRRTLAMLNERERFEKAAAVDPLRDTPPAAPFSRLGEADVMVVFVESYGRAALENPTYAPLTQAALERLQGAADARGFATASGWSRSPTIGGQSWLAHATLLSGLWIDNQIAYATLLASDRQLLPHFLDDGRRHRVLVMPAIVRPWPEADLLGFDRHLFAASLGYGGLPYNWVTMPDQYTLHAFETRERRRGDPPLFAMIALISSHAPWTPIAPVLDDWDAIGDGSVFSRWARDGDPPEVLWRDPERVREHYALSIDYVLRTLAGYLEVQGERPFLMIVLGDHEAGAIVAGAEASRDVPVHLIASDPDFLEPFGQWDYREGTRPEPEGTVTPMNAFRDFLLETYAAPAAGLAAGSAGSR